MLARYVNMFLWTTGFFSSTPIAVIPTVHWGCVSSSYLTLTLLDCGLTHLCGHDLILKIVYYLVKWYCLSPVGGLLEWLQLAQQDLASLVVLALSVLALFAGAGLVLVGCCSVARARLEADLSLRVPLV